VSANIVTAFFSGEVAKQRLLPVRVSPLELTQQAVAVLDAEIERLLRDFLPAKACSSSSSMTLRIRTNDPSRTPSNCRSAVLA